MSGNDLLSVVRSHWLGILLITVLMVGGSLGWYVLQPKVYAAESSGIVVTAGAENLGMSLAGDSLAKSKAKGYQSVGESILVAESVIKTLALQQSASDITRSISVSVPLDSVEIRITARSSDPQTAQNVADAWVAALAAQVYELDKENASPGTEPVTKIVPLAKATLPSAPISPLLTATLGIGLAAGLLIGLGYALARNHFDRRIRASGEIERLFGLAVVGTLPLDKRLSQKSSVLENTSGIHRVPGGHAMAEALRELRTNLTFIDVDNPPRILLITSSLPSEGKSTVTSNLAATIAAAGNDVIVIDADLRRPTVHQVFGVLPDVGVTDVLSGRASIDDVLQEWGPNPRLRILTAGRIPPNPSELLGSRAMEHLLKDLSQRAIVLIDAPPLLPVTDAAVLSRVADGTLVVARARKTTRDTLYRALGNLTRVRGRVLGVILNCVATNGPGDLNYGYYGAYGSADDAQAPSPRSLGTSRMSGPGPAQPALGGQGFEASSTWPDPVESAEVTSQATLSGLDGTLTADHASSLIESPDASAFLDPVSQWRSPADGARGRRSAPPR
ncbi:polysaccharide biosynthesis tyrosine autokinase [Paenarthrobacter aurescens]|uniref:Cell surface polysaccharide biosynthesis n=1 Tax=Paenarthrobacter aurescens (strain TC1) TaxID=290340 RepID=A1RC29_PAEAT|nr:polysaccharide biosynthesis tyrosine autokinase [Paenarthrobacter aurescens]ABM09425.1 putative cell surface polysaccharide biosynthesis [Paenarthrobacter aurescens TC1]